MRKFWQRNSEYNIPPKPEAESDQVSMIWDFIWNHLPDRLNKQDYKILKLYSYIGGYTCSVFWQDGFLIISIQRALRSPRKPLK